MNASALLAVLRPAQRGLTVSLLGHRYQPTIMLMIMSTNALIGAVITCNAATTQQM
jgi:hypothetical protein